MQPGITSLGARFALPIHPALETAKYDFFGRLREDAFFDGAGKPVFTEEGYSSVDFGYDTAGNLVDLRYAYDPDAKGGEEMRPHPRRVRERQARETALHGWQDVSVEGTRT